MSTEVRIRMNVDDLTDFHLDWAMAKASGRADMDNGEGVTPIGVKRHLHYPGDLLKLRAFIRSKFGDFVDVPEEPTEVGETE